MCSLENNYVSKFLLKLEFCLFFVDQILSLIFENMSEFLCLEPNHKPMGKQKTFKNQSTPRKGTTEGRKKLNVKVRLSNFI